jgi:hypothetical protein
MPAHPAIGDAESGIAQYAQYGSSGGMRSEMRSLFYREKQEDWSGENRASSQCTGNGWAPTPPRQSNTCDKCGYEEKLQDE